MKRDPSIHVKRSDLSWVLKEFFPDLDDIDITRVTQELRRYSCDNRGVTITNEKLKKDANRTISSTKGDTALMAEIIYSVRIKLKHRSVSKLKESDREWLQLKQLTKVVNEFCYSFSLDSRGGYITYITIAFTKISSMHSYISKFINMSEAIGQEYEAKLILDEDKEPGKTKAVHDDYVSLVASKTGIEETFLNKPLKMVAFFKVRLKCEELGIEPEVWLDAQFEALDYCNGLPAPENLAGEKALERLNKYLFQNNMSITKTKPKQAISSGFWDKLKKYGTDD